jgi:hypothetical protein
VSCGQTNQLAQLREARFLNRLLEFVDTGAKVVFNKLTVTKSWRVSGLSVQKMDGKADHEKAWCFTLPPRKRRSRTL